MRIKRVEIIGFKSFCDRAVVQIGESITGVVGPNGCGKSNIVDAIRWCMGEQSAKHLRGKAMEDVIFAGSDSRGPAPMAEVSLTFDDVGFSHEAMTLAKADETEAMLDSIPSDEDGEQGEQAELADAPEAIAEPQAPAPVETKGTWLDKDGNPIASPVEEVQSLLEDKPPAFEFSHYTEVTITRRLYRDGLSQYFINKTPCRLRDITDFFLGTGVGTKAYAIIEQGRIGQIVSSRPQDRRAIIEEAAGITKFKTKKKAAERKLDQTRQNLMRVSDIVTELDKRMGTLRRQAQKAERYRKYKSEMRDIELWKASHRWLELAGEASQVGGRLGEVRTELETARTEYAVKDATVVAERADLVVEERRLVGVQETVYELDNKIRLGDSKIGFELREADDLDHRIASARTEIDEVAGQRERGKLELDARTAELAALEADVARESGEVRTREEAAAEARAQLAAAEQTLESSRHELAEHKTTIAKTSAQLEALAHRRGEAAGRLERVTTETEALAKQIKELERESKRVDGALAQLRQTRLDLGSQGDDFKAKRELLADEVARGETEVDTLRTELNRRRSRLVSLEEIQARYEGFARGTRAVMQGAFAGRTEERIRGVVADVVRAPELLEVAVEAALGDRLGGVLVADREVGLEAVGFLKQQSGGRSAFVSMKARAGRDEAVQPIAFADSAATEGVPRVVPDDRFGEARFESAAVKTVRVTPAGGSPLGEDAAADASAVPEPVGAEGSAGSDAPELASGSGGIAEGVSSLAPSVSAVVEAFSPEKIASLAEQLDTLVARLSTPLSSLAWHADVELANCGAALRARSLYADAVLADPSIGTSDDVVLFSCSIGTEIFPVDQAGAVAVALSETDTDGIAAHVRAYAELDEGLRADVELANLGAALRARSLFADAALADPIIGEAKLFSIGHSLRARSLLADGRLAEAQLADAQLAAFHAAVAHTDVQLADAVIADPVLADALLTALSDSQRIDVRGLEASVPSVEEDARVWALGAALRARSLLADAWLEAELAARARAEHELAQAADARDAAEAPEATKPAIDFEDHSELVGAMVGPGRDEISEGVLGRMVDLVGFADGFESVGKRLLGRTVVVDHLRRAIDLHERGVTDRLVTLDGDIVDEDGVVAGGSREAQGAGVLAQKREIRDLHEIVGRLEHELSEAMQRLVTAKAQLTQVTKAIEGLRAQVHEGEVAIVGHEKDDARVRGELERHRKQQGHVANEQHELETRLAQITADETDNRERRAAAEQRIGELEQIQLDGIAQVAACREKLEELGKILTEARIRAAQLEAQRAAVESATLRLAQTDAELAARADRLAAECEASTQRAVALREGCERLAAELAQTREQRDAESRTLEEGRTAYQARASALSEIELAARDLRTRSDALGNELNQLELRHGQIAMTARMLCDQITERYQVELADVLPEYHQRKQVSDTEDERLTELRELIDRMGTDINLTAIDEFADVSTRFEFLSAQKIDLERAVDQLQKAIDKINKTSRKLFKDTFAAVNATFKEVYPRLFRGGRAYLSLAVPQAAAGEEGEGAPVKKRTEDDDLLEAGIEIFAQPPGKKNSTVEQLSGGEKALTAVALVFSIFLIKPSPFCILDEVDAPLDEANVDRYNEIVREMTDRSQFIVITHNKRTMEAADNLYGVTMQEPGVSKLVSVNLSRLGPGEQRPTKRVETAASV